MSEQSQRGTRPNKWLWPVREFSRDSAGAGKRRDGQSTEKRQSGHHSGSSREWPSVEIRQRFRAIGKLEGARDEEGTATKRDSNCDCDCDGGHWLWDNLSPELLEDGTVHTQTLNCIRQSRCRQETTSRTHPQNWTLPSIERNDWVDERRNSRKEG